MPKIQIYQRKVLPAVPQRPVPPSRARQWEGVEQFGNQLFNIGMQINKRQQTREYNQAIGETTKRLNDFQLQIEQDGDYSTHEEQFQKETQAILAEYTDPKMMKGKLARDGFAQWTEREFERRRVQILSRAQRLQLADMRGEHETALSEAIKDQEAQGAQEVDRLLETALDAQIYGDRTAEVIEKQRQDAIHQIASQQYYETAQEIAEGAIAQGADPQVAVQQGVLFLDNQEATPEWDENERAGQISLFQRRWNVQLALERDAEDKERREQRLALADYVDKVRLGEVQNPMVTSRQLGATFNLVSAAVINTAQNSLDPGVEEPVDPFSTAGAWEIWALHVVQDKKLTQAQKLEKIEGATGPDAAGNPRLGAAAVRRYKGDVLKWTEDRSADAAYELIDDYYEYAKMTEDELRDQVDDLKEVDREAQKVGGDPLGLAQDRIDYHTDVEAERASLGFFERMRPGWIWEKKNVTPQERAQEQYFEERPELEQGIIGPPSPFREEYRGPIEPALAEVPVVDENGQRLWFNPVTRETRPR